MRSLSKRDDSVNILERYSDRMWQNIASIWEQFPAYVRNQQRQEGKMPRKVNEASSFLLFLESLALIDICQIMTSDFKQVRNTIILMEAVRCSAKLRGNRKPYPVTTLFGSVLVRAYILPHCYHWLIDKMWCVDISKSPSPEQKFLTISLEITVGVR